MAFNAMCEAQSNYQKVLKDSIEKCGEVAVVDENEWIEDYNGTPCCRIEYYDGEKVWRYAVDKLRVVDDIIQFHVIETNYREADDWIPVDWIEDEGDFLFEAIVWPE